MSHQGVKVYLFENCLFQLWIVNCEFWILNCELWIVNCELWIVKRELWISILAWIFTWNFGYSPFNSPYTIINGKQKMVKVWNIKGFYLYLSFFKSIRFTWLLSTCSTVTQRLQALWQNSQRNLQTNSLKQKLKTMCCKF